jgi:hypothetical protein
MAGRLGETKQHGHVIGRGLFLFQVTSSDQTREIGGVVLTRWWS